MDWHTTLFSYGIALESHQQNTSVVLDEADGRPRLRLLLKDNDDPRVHPARLAARIGRATDGLLGFGDRRILVAGDGPVADVFATITVHLCAGALAFELARLGRGTLDGWLAQLRDRLAEAIARLAPGPAAVLRARVLAARRLPVKAMVTAEHAAHQGALRRHRHQQVLRRRPQLPAADGPVTAHTGPPPPPPLEPLT
ncbi:hypothetical protein GCM10020000_63780 [Streptomyces olivoverticillatus]